VRLLIITILHQYCSIVLCLARPHLTNFLALSSVFSPEACILVALSVSLSASVTSPSLNSASVVIESRVLRFFLLPYEIGGFEGSRAW